MTLHRLFATLLVAAALLFGPSAAFADDTTAQPVKAGSLEISGAFARATLPGAKSGGGYFTITNTGTTDDTLLSVTTPLAGKSMLHDSTMKGDVMEMTPVAGIAIPAGKTVTLNPSGLHVMFMALKGPFKKGATVPVTLTFAKAGKVELTLDVLGIAATGPAAAGAAAPMAGMAM